MSASLAGNIQAGGAYVRIWAEDKEVKKAFTRIQANLTALSDSATKFGAKLSGLGAAIAAPFIKSASTFMGFADTMSTIGSVTGAVGEDFDKLSDKAKHLGATTSFTAQEAAEAMLALGRAGFSTNEILAAIPGTLDVARAGAIGFGVAVKSLTMTLGTLAATKTLVVGGLSLIINILTIMMSPIGFAVAGIAALAYAFRDLINWSNLSRDRPRS